MLKMLSMQSELEVVRKFTALSKKAFGVDDGFYPLGSCTMKYNPKLLEVAASMSGFCDVHPLQDKEEVKGCQKILDELLKMLCDLTGFTHGSLQAAAGAHGELLALLMIKKYFEKKGEKRTKVIVPDTAHGTNPASAAVAGFEVISVQSGKDGLVCLDALKNVLDGKVAAIMLTNPNTLGLYEKNIEKITALVRSVGAINYYDGANLNAICGNILPFDMGFDIMHINVHKTFGTPHGGGGPGAGPILYREFLSPFNMNIKNFYGNFSTLIKAYTYIKMLGYDGIKEASKKAVENANYLREKLRKHFEMPYDTECMHEFVISLDNLKRDFGVTAKDFAKALIDEGMHPPTMYFPLVVSEALMIEPTETESKETLDKAAETFIKVLNIAKTNPEYIKNTPYTTPISRPDETLAAKQQILKRLWQ
jgi:glycine dehydrogenase subunit 2